MKNFYDAIIYRLRSSGRYRGKINRKGMTMVLLEAGYYILGEKDFPITRAITRR